MLTRPWLVAAIASALLSGEASAQGSWTPMKPIPQGANEVIGAAVDGRLYVYGGERMQTQHVYGGVNLKTQPLGIFWSYDPKADTWNQLKPIRSPPPRGCGRIGKKFYVLGGFRLPDTGRIGWYPENKVWVYDSETQSWSALPPMPTLRGALAAVGEDSVGMELSDGLTAGGRVEVVARWRCSTPRRTAGRREVHALRPGALPSSVRAPIAAPHRSAQRKLPRLPPWRSRTLRNHRLVVNGIRQRRH